MSDDISSKTYALWLPLNKDFFGFDNYWEAPLNIFSEINKEYSIEHPVLLRSKEMVEKMAKEKFFKYTFDNTDIKENQRHSRECSFNIKSNKDKKIGTFTIFSNGLYLWKFEEERSKDDILNHIKILFDIETLDETDTSNSEDYMDFFKNYSGILNYFQLELLLDILYNIHIAPSIFFNIYPKGHSKYTKIANKFKLINILESILLFEKDENFNSFSRREKYSLKAPNDDNTIYLASTMEQFIRVANTFSLEHYRRGSHYCLKNLTEIGSIRTDISQDNVNYNFPSILAHKSSMMKLESYHGMLYAKLPHLQYINSLYIGIQSIYLNDEKYLTLKQAIEQNSRRLKTINDFFTSIEKLLEEENSKSIHYEIAELRKNNEINNQLVLEDKEIQKNDMFDSIKSNNKHIYELFKKTLSDNTSSINHGIYALTFLTFLVALLTPIITVDKIKNFSDIFDQLKDINYPLYIFISVIVLFVIFLYKKCFAKKTENIYNKFKKFFATETETETETNDVDRKKSLYVFDNTHIDIDKNIEGIYANLVNYFNSEDSIISKSKMPSLLNKNETINCIKMDSVRERYRSYKLYKFTFSSDYEKNKKIKYTIDIDIQYDTIGDHDIEINNIRMAIIDEENINEKELINIYNRMREIKTKLNKQLEDKIKKPLPNELKNRDLG